MATNNAMSHTCNICMPSVSLATSTNNTHISKAQILMWRPRVRPQRALGRKVRWLLCGMPNKADRLYCVHSNVWPWSIKSVAFIFECERKCSNWTNRCILERSSRSDTRRGAPRSTCAATASQSETWSPSPHSTIWSTFRPACLPCCRPSSSSSRGRCRRSSGRSTARTAMSSSERKTR